MMTQWPSRVVNLAVVVVVVVVVEMVEVVG